MIRNPSVLVAMGENGPRYSSGAFGFGSAGVQMGRPAQSQSKDDRFRGAQRGRTSTNPQHVGQRQAQNGAAPNLQKRPAIERLAGASLPAKEESMKRLYHARMQSEPGN